MKYLVCVLLLAGCTSENKAIRAAEDYGFKNIKITGYRFWACSKDDFYHTGFEAENQNGKFVSGTVCSGLLFRGSTVRLD